MKRLVTMSIIAAIVIGAVFTTKADSPRMVLVEGFTNTYCGPCGSNNPIFHPWLKERQDQLIPLMYHVHWPVDNDPFNIHNKPMVNSRLQMYQSMTGGGFSAPSAVVDGLFYRPSIQGADYLDAIYNNINGRLGETSPIDIELSLVQDGDQLVANIEVASSADFSNTTLYVVLSEYFVPELPNNQGNNGETEFHWVPRKMIPTNSGTSFSIGANGSTTYEFFSDIDAEWDETQMYAVAFIQDNQTNEVYQAAVSKEFVKIDVDLIGAKFNKVSPGGMVEIPISITNPLTQRIDVKLSVTDVINLGDASDFETSFDKDEFQLNITMDTEAKLQVSLPAERSGLGIFDVNINASTTNPESGIGIDGSKIRVFVMADNVKSVLYSFSNSESPIDNMHLPNWGSLEVHPDYAPAAFVPASEPSILDAYPATDYDVVQATFNIAGAEAFSSSASLRNRIQGWIDNDVDMLMEGEVLLYFAYLTDQSGNYVFSQGVRDFFENNFGVSSRTNMDGSPALFGLINNNQLSQVTLYGVDGDPITDGFQANLNNGYNQQSYPFYAAYYGAMNIENENKAIPFLQFRDQNDNNYNIGVRVDNGEQRLALFASGLYSYNNDTRIPLTVNIVNWLKNNMPEPEGPQLTHNKPLNRISFGKVDGSKNDDFVITNSGEQNLSITNIEITGDDAGVFEVLNPGNSTIPGGEDHTITLRFTPKENTDYTATLVIESNAENTPILELPLLGTGNKPTSVIDGVAYMQGVLNMEVGPNPMVDQALLTYNIESNAAVDINISLFDVAGNEIMTLVNSSKAPGSHNLTISGNNLANGTYFVRATANGKAVQLPVVVSK